jgi:hypothetical protein
MSGKTCEKKTSNDGMLTTSTITSIYANDLHLQTKMTISVRLPSVMKPEYWKLHDLSNNDINFILNLVDSKTSWLACMSEGIDVAAGSLKTSHDCAQGILISGKSTAIKKFMKNINIPKSLVDKIDEFDHHLPPLPRHFIGHEEMRLISQIIAPTINAKYPVLIPGVYHFKESIWVPVSNEGNGIVAYKLSLLKHFPEKTQAWLFKPILVIFDEEVYGLTDNIVRFFE